MYKEENWNLEVEIQDLQNQLYEAQSDAQSAENENEELDYEML